VSGQLLIDSAGTPQKLSVICLRDTPIAINRLCVLETLLSCFLRDMSTISM
jgi:hypothetical protein